jgi:hypothetical protein
VIDQEWIEERAAILEFEAGHSRRLAENRAVEMWHRHCKDMIEFEKRGGKCQAD